LVLLVCSFFTSVGVWGFGNASGYANDLVGWPKVCDVPSSSSFTKYGKTCSCLGIKVWPRPVYVGSARPILADALVHNYCIGVVLSESAEEVIYVP